MPRTGNISDQWLKCRCNKPTCRTCYARERKRKIRAGAIVAERYRPRIDAHGKSRKGVQVRGQNRWTVAASEERWAAFVARSNARFYARIAALESSQNPEVSP